MRVRKWIIRILTAIMLLAIGFAVLVRTLVVNEPSWYRPIVLDEAAQALSQQQLQNRIADLRNKVGKAQVRPVSSEPWPTFDIEITEAEINGTISRWQTWPQLGGSLGKVREPHIRFLKDKIEFAGRAGEGGPLISIELSVDNSASGQLADGQSATGPRVQLGRPWAGRMPLLRSILEDAHTDLQARLRDSPVPGETIASLAALIAGDWVAPIVAVPSSVVGHPQLLPARVEKLTIEAGVLKATLRPFDAKGK